MEAVCREALATFDGELAQLWALAGDEAVLVHQEPPDLDHPPGTRCPRRDVTGLEESLARNAPIFAEVPPTEGPTDSDAPFRLVGGRRALQIPIVVARRRRTDAARDLVGRARRQIGRRPSCWHDAWPTTPVSPSSTRSGGAHRRRRAAARARPAVCSTSRRHSAPRRHRSSWVRRRSRRRRRRSVRPQVRFLRLSGDDLVLLASSGYTPQELAGWERFRSLGARPARRGGDAERGDRPLLARGARGRLPGDRGRHPLRRLALDPALRRRPCYRCGRALLRRRAGRSARRISSTSTRSRDRRALALDRDAAARERAARARPSGAARRGPRAVCTRSRPRSGRRARPPRSAPSSASR